ncbi:branched-chain amino acid transport system II carrier protein, partial [Lactiplantibacillus plantarum]
RNLAVYASELVPNTGQQLTLFTDPQRQIKAERLNGVIDEIHRRFGFLSYKAWLRITCLASFLTANAGLNQIIAWSTPVLMFLYPLAMALIFLSILSPLFHKSSVVYVWVVVFTVVPAVFDMVAAFPAV